MNIFRISATVILTFLSLPNTFSHCLETLNLDGAIVTDTYSVGRLLKSHSNIQSWLSCARLCLLRSVCNSFNYNKDTLECQISWEYGVFSHLDSFPSWIFGEKRYIPEDIVDGCANHDCYDHQICVPGVNGAYSCLDVDECVPWPGRTLENIIHKKVNGTLQLSCSDGLFGFGYSVTHCHFYEGEFYWELDFNCYNTSACSVWTGNLAIYTGIRAETSDGTICDNWNVTSYSDAQLAEVNVSRSTNYCRDIDHSGFVSCPVKHPPPVGVLLIMCDVESC